MEKKQRKEIIDTIAGAYPRFFEPKSEYDSPKAKMKLWNNRLTEWDYEKTLKNLNNHIDNSVFEPKIAEIKPKGSTDNHDWEDKLNKIMNGGGENC